MRSHNSDVFPEYLAHSQREVTQMWLYFAMSVFLSICPHVAAREPLNRFSSDLIWVICINIYVVRSKFG
jgi:hypothetical protein